MTQSYLNFILRFLEVSKSQSKYALHALWSSSNRFSKKPMSDSEIIQFALHHLKFTGYDTYHYEPLNYTLLTGVLIKLMNQPYETLLKKKSFGHSI